jgi:hypothetical protein
LSGVITPREVALSVAVLTPSLDRERVLKFAGGSSPELDEVRVA